jgi:HemY protein
LRKAARIVEVAWKANPHPDLADTYAHLRPGDSARERLARVETLAQMTPGNVEGALAVARAALDAQEFAIARHALSPLSIVPTQRVAMLMSELEETEHGDEGRAREWMTRALHARRDPAWTADGFVSDHWLPISPVTGRLDAFQWKDPLAGREPSGALIESEARQRPLLDAHGPARLPEEPVAEGPPAEAEPASLPAQIRPRPPVPRAIDKVIPLVHVPDDPGPEPAPEAETAAGANSTAWRKLFR